jgi:hypothetical protein
MLGSRGTVDISPAGSSLDFWSVDHETKEQN